VRDTIEGVPGLIRIEYENPLVVSCAKCGGVTQIWGYDPAQLLPWKVIEHLLIEHWDDAHDETLLDGQEGPVTGWRDPTLVRVEEAVIVVTTDCCHKEMPLARQRIDPAEPNRLSCFRCGRRRQFQLVVVWSDPPGTRRRRR
jgi:hypothetical protein